jgi:Protein of unknown function (DUF1566)
VAFLLSGELCAQQVCDSGSYPLSSPTTNFQDNADGTVTDTKSKLMWMRCSVGQTWANAHCSGAASKLDWASAQAHALQVNNQGSLFFNDWRLPLLRELATITERQCKNPRINLAVFPGTPMANFWTASSRAAPKPAAHAFALAFDTEGVHYADKQDLMHVRLVRSAQ